MKCKILTAILIVIAVIINPAAAQKKKEAAREPEKKESGLSSTFSGMSFRSIGPAWASGRISDFAVNPYLLFAGSEFSFDFSVDRGEFRSYEEEKRVLV